MTKPLLLAAAASAALIALSACNSEPEIVGGGPADPQGDALKNAPPVELPPSITASKQYRCSDNSLYIVDFYSNNTATIRRRQPRGRADHPQRRRGRQPALYRARAIR